MRHTTHYTEGNPPTLCWRKGAAFAAVALPACRAQSVATNSTQVTVLKLPSRSALLLQHPTVSSRRLSARAARAAPRAAHAACGTPRELYTRRRAAQSATNNLLVQTTGLSLSSLSQCSFAAASACSAVSASTTLFFVALCSMLSQSNIPRAMGSAFSQNLAATCQFPAFL